MGRHAGAVRASERSVNQMIMMWDSAGKCKEKMNHAVSAGNFKEGY